MRASKVSLVSPVYLVFHVGTKICCQPTDISGSNYYLGSKEQFKVTDEAELTVRETAARLQVTIGHIYTLLYGDILKARKLGNMWMISVSSIEQRERKLLARQLQASERRKGRKWQTA